ncbi:M1 family metallopeptidase [Chitinophaga pinensis]|uniref:M1 family metallopeptidase n=1 Tax=Chitinophaga pinensis TaxID=79329 RepID=A0A5C6LXS5_9BACT|nr:M1 family metallopeptidase [Chitinophaga pinensis]TWW02043.1 M1 family metallopeptidase [Chitinophaga pinensis]
MTQTTVTKCLLACLLIAGWQGAKAQSDRWQQRVKYAMDINMDVAANRFSGKQKLQYTNNSPDTLYKVFYHLYWNAFQPGSMMDVRSRELGQTVLYRDKNGNERRDWDGRVTDRISKLQPDQIGYQKILSLKRDGATQTYNVIGTILEVPLAKPILPHATATFDMEFEAQVPVQIRRSGRNNSEGVDYSMAQWYPKMCEYDYEGWHPTPYIAREFYGIWGDYDVKISIDKKYVVAATGYLQNPNQIGYGYEMAGSKVLRPAGNKLTWHFSAQNVHDFVWAADPDYKHITQQVDGFTAHFFYIENETTKETWPTFAKMIPTAYKYIKEHYGPYPYKSYSFIQGGDGGMEYPMATLIMGNGKLEGLYGLAAHEWMHTWYQGMLGTNESLYPWMDEGFTTFAENNVVYHTLDSTKSPSAQTSAYNGYFALVRSGYEEPMSTHSDHYNTNYGYSLTAYSKGAVFLEQLGYIIGAEARDKGLLKYYWEWRFKHPNVNDFIRIMEKESGLQLDWYKQYFVYSTKHIDYSIDSVFENNGKTVVRLRRVDNMPMPIDLLITGKDGKQVMHYVPMSLMFGAKPNEDAAVQRVVHDYWPWTNRTYDVEIDMPMSEIKKAEIDPSERMADLNRSNNEFEQ